MKNIISAVAETIDELFVDASIVFIWILIGTVCLPLLSPIIISMYIYRVIKGGAVYIYTYKRRRLEEKLKAQEQEEEELELFIDECLEPTKSLLARVHNDVRKLQEHNYGIAINTPSNPQLSRRINSLSERLKAIERKFIDECENNKE